MASLLTILVVLGAVGLFLAMPGHRPRITWLGQLCLAAAAVVLFELVLRWLSPQPGVRFFASGAVVAAFAAVRVITHPKPVYSALYFVLLIIAVAALLVHEQAEFLAAALVIIYAGAILVTYLFVIMLAQQGRPATYDVRAHEPLLGAVAGFVLLWAIAARLFAAPVAAVSPAAAALPAGTVAAVGTPLLTTYVLGIELIGLLLLVAMVGAIAIARRRPVNERQIPEGP